MSESNGVESIDMLATLERLVKDEGWGTDVVLCYDEEDGFWLASLERGSLGVHKSKDNEDVRRGSIAEAIKAAVDYEREEKSRPRTRFIP